MRQKTPLIRRRTIPLNKIISKLAALSAAATAFFSCTPFSAFADELQGAENTLYDGSFYYELNPDMTYTITKCSATIVTEVPSIRNGTAITAIGDGAFQSCTGITSLKIPDSITTIAPNAFYDCASLKSVTLPKKLTYLGDHAFFGCISLESVELPDTLTKVEPFTFALCQSLSDIKLSNNVTDIGEYAFYQCASISGFRLPASLTSIGDNAMGCWFSLQEIDASANSSFVYEDEMLMDSKKNDIIRASVNKSGELIIPEGTVNIRSGAFSTCAQLTSLHIPSSVTAIGDEAFSYCSGLKSVDFSEGLETIGLSAFMFDNKITSLSIPTTVSMIDDNAFAYCESLSKVILPEGVKTIGADAFFVCDELKQVSIPKSVSSIGDDAFGFTYESPERKPVEGFSLSVFSGSAGAKYAKSEKISYTVTDFNIKKIAFIVIMLGALAAAAVFAAVLMKRGWKLGASGARKAAKKAKELEAEKAYKKIMGDDAEDKSAEKNGEE